MSIRSISLIATLSEDAPDVNSSRKLVTYHSNHISCLRTPSFFIHFMDTKFKQRFRERKKHYRFSLMRSTSSLPS